MEKFEKREAHPLEKYVGRLVSLSGEEVEVVGYRDNEYTFPLIADASKIEGWYLEFSDPQDVVFKECESYRYLSINDLTDWKIMIRNKDFAMPYAGRAVFDRNGEFAVVGRNGMHGVIVGVDHADGRQSWGANDTGVSEEEFLSCRYRNTGMPAGPGGTVAEETPKHKTTGELIKEHEGVSGIQFSTDGHGNVQAACIRGKRGGMKPVGMGDGSGNAASKI